MPSNLFEFIESAIISKSISNGLMRKKVLTILEKEDFANPFFSKIFETLKLMDEKKEQVDKNTVFIKLSNAKVAVDEYEYNQMIVDIQPDEVIEQYLIKLQDNSVLTQLKKSIKLADSELTKDKPIEEIFFNIEKLIVNSFKKRRLSQIENISDSIEDVIEKIKSISLSESRLLGVPSGLSSLDNYTKGFSEGDLVIIAARPSMGKTAIATNFLMNVGEGFTEKDKSCVVLFSIEMSKEQVIQRLISSKSAISLEKIRLGNLSEKEIEIIEEFSAKIKRSNIYINDDSNLKLAQLQSSLRELSLRQKIKLVVIDYLQLITHDMKNENRQQEITYISKALKSLARELKTPIIALSQLSRKVEQREDKRPMMSDLRESGALEQDSDLVMFLYRDAYYNKKAHDKYTDTQETEIIIAKHRNGPTGTIKVNFITKFCSFVDN